MENKLMLLSIHGPDYPGITGQLTEVIAKFDGHIKDMGQSITHGLLSLSILCHIPDEKQGDNFIKELLFLCRKIQVYLTYEYVSDEIINKHNPHNERYALCCVGPKNIPAQFISQVSTFLADHRINIDRIFSDMKKNNQQAHLEFLISQSDGEKSQSQNNWQLIKQRLLEISIPYQLDFALVKDDIFRYNKRLFVFDMDSTLTRGEVIDELAKIMGVSSRVEAITKDAMNGKIEFQQALRKRVEQLKGLQQEQLEQVARNLKYNPGVEQFVKILQSLGCKTAVVSGGFSFFTDIIAKHLGLDYHHGNELEIQDGKLTGNLVGDIIDGPKKAVILKSLAQKLSIRLEQVAAIGDGANDIAMLSTAGMGIAFHAKSIVKQYADQHLSFNDMASLKWFLGIPKNFT